MIKYYIILHKKVTCRADDTEITVISGVAPAYSVTIDGQQSGRNSER